MSPTVDRQPDTVPNAAQDATTYTTTVDGDGTWYLHLRAVDNAGNTTTTQHVAFDVVAGDLAADVREPERTVLTRSADYGIRGRTEAGATLRAFRDDDGDGAADDPSQPVATQQLDEATLYYELVVPLREGSNDFVVVATLGNRTSSVLPVPAIQRQIVDPNQQGGEYETDRVAVMTDSREGGPVLAAMQAAGTILGWEASAPGIDDSVLDRWNHVDVPAGTAAARIDLIAAQQGVTTAHLIPVDELEQVASEDPLIREQRFLQQINAFAAWQRADGRVGDDPEGPPVRVAVADSEFDLDHPDLVGKFEEQINVTEGCPDAANTHGTSVSGLIAAINGNGVGVAGVGVGARVVPIQAGQGPGCDGVAGQDSVNRLPELAQDGVQIANLSFGSRLPRSPTAEEQDMIRVATNHGMLVMASAGNRENAEQHAPSDVPLAVSVAAVDGQSVRAEFSNFGPAVDIAAPGTRHERRVDGVPQGPVWIATTKDRRTPDCAYDMVQESTVIGNPEYCTFNGTSAASPIVAGTAALITGELDGPGGLRVRHRLLDAARDLGDPGLGHGLLDAGAAVTDRAVRLSGPTRIETSEQITQEAFPVVAAGEVEGNVLDRVVLAPADTDSERGWLDTLPSLGLAGLPGTAVVLAARNQVHPRVDDELARVFNLPFVDRRSDDRQVLIAGNDTTSLSLDIEQAYQDRFDVRRVAGADSAATAAALADAIVEGRIVEEALVVTSATFADAVSMSAVAADRALPLLYVERDRVPPATCDWIGAHDDIRTLHIAGGTNAVSGDADSGTEAALAACSDTGAGTVRHAGPTRIETSVAIAQDFFATAHDFSVANAFFWPDAVVGGNLGRAYGAPVLLTAEAEDGSVEPEVRGYLEDRRAPDSEVFVLGGVGVINAAVEATLEEIL